MEKCNCYHERTRKRMIYGGGTLVDETYGICYGTRECDECHCEGNLAKCDFYPEKRKEAEKKMNTAEMWLKAHKDGKVYECINGDIAYSKKTGLVDKDDFNKTWQLGNWDYDGAHALDELLGGCEWREKAMKLMTRAEAEKEYQIKIVD